VKGEPENKIKESRLFVRIGAHFGSEHCNIQSGEGKLSEEGSQFL
jgi:hypothetical protein